MEGKNKNGLNLLKCGFRGKENGRQRQRKMESRYFCYEEWPPPNAPSCHEQGKMGEGKGTSKRAPSLPGGNEYTLGWGQTETKESSGF